MQINWIGYLFDNGISLCYLWLDIGSQSPKIFIALAIEFHYIETNVNVWCFTDLLQF